MKYLKSFRDKINFASVNDKWKNLRCVFPQVNNNLARLACVGTGLSLIAVGTIGTCYVVAGGSMVFVESVLVPVVDSVVIPIMDSVIDATSSNTTKSRPYKSPQQRLDGLETIGRRINSTFGIVYPACGVSLVYAGIYKLPVSQFYREMFKQFVAEASHTVKLIRNSDQCCTIIRKTSGLVCNMTLPYAISLLFVPLVVCIYGAFPVIFALPNSSTSDENAGAHISLNWWICN